MEGKVEILCMREKERSLQILLLTMTLFKSDLPEGQVQPTLYVMAVAGAAAAALVDRVDTVCCWASRWSYRHDK